METPTFNTFGPVYERGKELSEGLKTNSIQDIIEQGGDITTSFPPESLEAVGLKHRVKLIPFVRLGNIFAK